MRIFDKIEAYSGSDPVVLSIGNFDGLHRGHQYLLQRNQELATKKGARSSVLSFHPHPMQLLKPDLFRPLSIREDQALGLEQIGIDDLFIEPFTTVLQNEEPEEFLTRLIAKVPVCAIVVGPDFRFGKERKGDVSLLQSWGQSLGVEVVLPPAYFYLNERVSSSRIRSLLGQGKVESAAELLGRSFSLRGKIISGFRRGHQIGFPTANIKSPAAANLLCGVYKTMVHLHGKRWLSITNVGFHPTFGEESEVKVETHIFDFCENIYGDDIRVEFLRFIRPEMKFNGIAELKGQITKDIELAKKE